MKEPKNWSLTVADKMVFNIFVIFGWHIFKSEKGKEVAKEFENFVDATPTYEEFIEKITEEVKKETHRGKICLYVPSAFFPFLFAQLKKKSVPLTDEDVIGAWERYLKYLKFAYQTETNAKKRGTEIKQMLTPRKIIDDSKERLKALQKVFNFCDTETIQYFCYLSEQYIKEFKSKTEN